jgi:hypothetical protein
LDRKEGIYQKALGVKSTSNSEDDYSKATELFISISGYKDADILAAECDILAEQARNEAEQIAEERRNAEEEARIEEELNRLEAEREAELKRIADKKEKVRNALIKNVAFVVIIVIVFILLKKII